MLFFSNDVPTRKDCNLRVCDGVLINISFSGISCYFFTVQINLVELVGAYDR